MLWLKIFLNDFNIHRILFSSILISNIQWRKIFEHKYYSSTAVNMIELKELEMDFLKLINYNVFVFKKIIEK